MSFVELLERRVAASNSLLCVGLDPHSHLLEEDSASAAAAHCIRVIEQTHQFAAAFKPNAAFFEAFGAAGVDALHRVIAAIPRDIPVILDAKRGDISTTAEAYARAAFERAKAQSITVNPYMGWDAVEPFVRDNATGVFVLCHTSNPSAQELQLQSLVAGGKVYDRVAEMVCDWVVRHGKNNIGLVVGATQSSVQTLAHIRQSTASLLSADGVQRPGLWILCPGVGAQGGDLEQACIAGLREDGSGLLITVSRGISQASDPARTAESLRDAINEIRHRRREMRAIAVAELRQGGGAMLPYQAAFLQLSLDMNVLRFGSFTLKSGRVSPYFFNAGLFSSGSAMHKLGSFYADAICRAGVEFDVLFGPAYKGIPLATAVAMCLSTNHGRDVDIAYNRKEAKDHGEGGNLVGAPVQGRRVLVIDDVITAGTAIRETMAILQPAGANVVGLVLALDRQERMSDTSELSAVQSVTQEFHIPVWSICKLEDLMTFVQQTATQPENHVASKFGLTVEIYEEMVKYKQRYGAAPATSRVEPNQGIA